MTNYMHLFTQKKKKQFIHSSNHCDSAIYVSPFGLKFGEIYKSIMPFMQSKSFLEPKKIK